jgi:hypothetical protein
MGIAYTRKDYSAYWFYYPALVLVRDFGPNGHEMVTKSSRS